MAPGGGKAQEILVKYSGEPSSEERLVELLRGGSGRRMGWQRRKRASKRRTALKAAQDLCAGRGNTARLGSRYSWVDVYPLGFVRVTLSALVPRSTPRAREASTLGASLPWPRFMPRTTCGFSGS